MRRIDKAMVLAAGQGLRARPLSLVRPKPLFPLLNRPTISWSLEYLQAAGIRSAAVNAHHLARQIEEYLTDLDMDLRVELFKESRILGTGGGVKNAAPFLKDGPFFLINSVVRTDIDLAALAADHLAHQPAATLVMHDLPRFNQVAVDPEGNIQGFSRLRPEAGGPDCRKLAFCGLHVVDPSVLEAIPDGSADIIAVYQNLIDQGRAIRAHVLDRPAWWKTETPEDYLAMHAGLIEYSRAHRIILDPTAQVHPDAKISGWACLGPKVVVESGALIENSVLWSGARVGAGVKVKHSVLTDRAAAKSDLMNGCLIADGIH